jgi:hypothetical protein
MFQLQWQKLLGKGGGGKGSLGIKDRDKRGELRVGGCRREKGCYDIMPYPSSPLLSWAFIVGETQSGSREAEPEQKGK